MSRVREAGEWPPVNTIYNPADYAQDDPGEGATDGARRACRGRVELADIDPVSGERKWRNYSFHEVDIYPNGGALVVRGCNFSFTKIRVHGTGSVEFNDCTLNKARWRSVDPPNGAVLTFVNCPNYLGQGD